MSASSPAVATGVVEGDAPTRRRRPHATRSMTIIVSVLLLAFALVGWVQSRQLELLSGTVQYNGDNVVWSFFQLESEHLHLRDLLREATRNPDSFDRDLLQHRYDIFVSRLSLVDPATTSRIIPTEAIQVESLASVHAFVDFADTLLGETAAAPVDAAALAVLLARLSPLADTLHDLSLWANVQVAEKVSRRNDAVRLQNRVAIILTVFQGLLTLAFAVIVMRQLRALADRSASLERLAARLQEARREAESASESKTAFLANMSHEIRTPLTAIIGFADLLLDVSRSGIDRSLAVQTIIRNGRHLLAVINNILDVSKIEAGRIEIEHIEIDTVSMLRDLSTVMLPRAQDKRLAFEIEPQGPLPSRFFGDPVRIAQILLNFCSNAVKFTEQGSVKVVVDYAEASKQLTFAVVDTGVGISEVQLARLFQPFAQADASTTRRYGGTGLGLFLSRQMAEAIGARVAVASRVDAGSRFELVLTLRDDEVGPMMAPSTNGLPASPVDRRSLSELAFSAVPALQGRVLLAEDGVDNQRLIAAYLQRSGLSVTVVDDGAKAVEAALTGHFDLVLMDIQMPVLDGGSAVRELRLAGYRRPIAALTANVLQSDVAHYRALGCDDVLAKPIEQERFYAAVAALVGRADSPQASPVGALITDAEFDEEMATLAAEFAARLPAQLAAIEQAHAASDRSALRELAHQLKGSAGSFGFSRLTTVAARLESAVLRGDRENIDRLCACLLEEGRRASGDPSRPLACAGAGAVS